MNTELSTLFIGRKLIRLQSVDSTNRFLTQLTSEQQLPEGTAVISSFQSTGRGQANSAWNSEAGKNVLMSVLFYPNFLEAKNIFLLSKAMALGLRDFTSSLLSMEGRAKNVVKIKWPNDIYVGDKKICGMLMENSIRGTVLQHSVVGIGFNVNQEIFPADIPNPVSLKLLTGKDLSLDDCFNGLCNHLESRYLQLKAGQAEKINSDYLQGLYRYGEYYIYESKEGRFEACMTDVDSEGKLLLKKKDGAVVKYDLKEVRFV